MAERRRISVDYKPPSVAKPNFGGSGNSQQNVLLGYMLGQMKGQGQRELSGQNVPGNLPEGVDPDDFRMIPKVRDVGGALVQNPEWERKPDPDMSEADVVSNIDKAISESDSLISELKSKNYKTGPFQWRWSNKLPGASTYMRQTGSPEEQAFKQRVDRMLQTYLLAQSGVQRGFKEIGWLQSAIPNTEQYPAAFEESAKAFKKDLLRNRQNTVNALRQRGKAISSMRDYIPTEIEATDQDLEVELRRLYMEGE